MMDATSHTGICMCSSVRIVTMQYCIYGGNFGGKNTVVGTLLQSGKSYEVYTHVCMYGVWFILFH